METSMVKGIVKWFDPKKGFGFVVNETGEDVFVHYSSIEGEGFLCLRSGQHVEYRQLDTEKGLTAREVRPIAESDRNFKSQTPREEPSEPSSM